MTDKDRSQLLRMAGNIACGITGSRFDLPTDRIAEYSAEIALATMKAVDKLIQDARE
jgi:hypothetical protein